MKEEISRLPKDVVPGGAGLRGDERDGISSSEESLKLETKAGQPSEKESKRRGKK